ncbi:HAMP domain-containing sensor histidine kinase [Maribellus sp. YY47]|uniref:sensor histidine kinase n=1 Tax=Maribellus sp. YY47 TaxID=2929486 RepID=UPI002000619A|nr:HAMP domain-containing sensor histidine kinase [Maribellus sp. YY47]MCK3683925.1 ATP-binding protein [Maribellus sp. YY47]
MRKLNKYTYLFVAILILITAAVLENGLLKRHPETALIQDFQDKLIDNEKELKSRVHELGGKLATEDFEVVVDEFFQQKETNILETGFGFLVYQDSDLVFWSDRSIAFYDTPDSLMNKKAGFARLPNGYYLLDTMIVNDFRIYGLQLIKNHYTFENKYLQNNFYSDYKIPNDYIIEAKRYDDAYVLYDAEGNFLFSLWPYGKYLCTTKQLYLPGFIYLLGLIVLLFYFRREFIAAKAPFALKLTGLGGALFIVYWIHLLFRVPKVFYHLKFFGPDFFAINYWLPSLGDYFLLSVFFLFWVYNFAIDLRLKELKKNTPLPEKWIIGLLLLFAGTLFLMVHYLIGELINNSTISFALNKITGISFQSVLGIFSMGLLLLGIIYLIIRIADEAKGVLRLKQVFLYALLIALFLAGVQWIAIGQIYYYVLVLFVAGTMLACLLSERYLETFTLSYLIVFVSLVSVYSLMVINQTISEKEKGQQKWLAIKLVNERDPAAEVFLAEIQSRLESDPAIQSLLLQREDVAEYIEKSYFNTYFRKYLLNIYVCDSIQQLIIQPDDEPAPCSSFMDNLIASQGIQIPGTHFYFMNNMNGRVSYTGRFTYDLKRKGGLVDIFIDLDSDLLFEGIGFPELLIDKSIVLSDVYRKFSYAKYYGGELTDKFGDYNYNYYGHVYLTSDEEFSFIRQDKYEHLVYHSRENNYVVVTRELLTFIDYLIAFPYLFVFYFLLLLIILVIGNSTLRERRFSFNLKFKIQAAIISIVFVSLLVVALVTIFYNVKQFKSKHSEDLDEKMKSISEEIDMRLTNQRTITPEIAVMLQGELIKLSNIFRTDINIYGTNGRLIASSRSEIFDKELVSPRINSRAYYEVFYNFKINYFQPENIGSLSYLSAYRPLLNDWNDYLGFINLPYFIKQDSYSQEISTYIVAFINLYVLLFLASIIAAVFIANQITRPLVLIQENLQKMQLGKRNEPIQYSRQDEIGRLVKEYNKKVEELAMSAELLAQSERESAWREMAKQIAHEIKNPLTPMKLNIQYLQRSKGKDEDYNKHLERVTNILIEQIDNLSNIATEFSNFAKIPTASNQVFKLAEQLQKTIDLYETYNQAEIVFHANGCENLEVNADKEQLSRAIINLIRNAIQSIPDDRKGKISLDLTQQDDIAVIAVTDNGSGIPVELRHKLFTPSFTTKTSGMGLGLAIVKNIVENFSGKIWFETEIQKGTTFFIEMPVYQNNSEIHLRRTNI